MHLLGPVAQRVHHQPQSLRLVHVHRIAAPGVVDVVSAVVSQSVVGRVVDAAEAQRRAVLAALGGVVEDDVEDHLEPRRVQVADHPAKLVDLAAPVAGRGVPIVWREVADRLISPVVAQPALDQERVVDVGVDGEQLDRGHAKPLQMGNRGRIGQSRVGTPEPRADPNSLTAAMRSPLLARGSGLGPSPDAARFRDRGAGCAGEEFAAFTPNAGTHLSVARRASPRPPRRPTA